MATNRRVSYFYDEEAGTHHYGPGHPMKPARLSLCHSLVENYGLYRQLEVLLPARATALQMSAFHTDDYIDFLRRVTPDNQMSFLKELPRYNLDIDCPVFDGLYQYCQISAGGSVGGAYRLNRGLSDVAINWAGGLHHAKKSKASGFCYVNDIVLGILELLKYHARVLYIDIDIHHGDGVEEAFYTTDRVMSVSFHKYGDFFPGTGSLADIGAGAGKHHSINFPLRDGIDDESFVEVFRQVLSKVMEVYRPGAVVLQCGADSLSGDRLGVFNLSLRGHGQCVEFMSSFGVPLLLLGGGGYTVRNVARCWAYETAVAVGAKLPDEIPYNQYYEFYGPEFQLHITPSNMENLNSRRELEETTMQVFDILSHIDPVPSIPYNTPIIADSVHRLQEEADATAADEGDKDVRLSQLQQDRMVDHRADFYAGDNDVDGDDKMKTSNPATMMR